MKIRVQSAQVVERTIKRQRDGKEFRFREQQGLVQVGLETRIVNVGLADDQAPYPSGEYMLLDGSFFVDRNGRLQVGRLALQPVVAGAADGSARRAG